MKPTVLNAGQNYHVRGGSDSYLLDLGRLLESKGHRVVPFAAAHPDNEATPWAEYFPHGADMQHPGAPDLLRFLYNPEAARRLSSLLAAVPVQVAHLHIYYGRLTASILTVLQAAGVPIVQTLHDYKLVCPVYTLVSNEHICQACNGTHYWHALPRRCNRNSLARTIASVIEAYVSRTAGSWDGIDHFIGPSSFMRDKMIELGVPADRITTIHNFIDAQRFAPAGERGEHFLYFGRMERVKGIFTLLSAMEGLPDVPCLLVGDGNARMEIEERIARAGLDHVRFLGFRSRREVESLIQRSICTVLPSEWYENCPMSVLESLACARPVVGARIGGLPELVRHGADGLLVEPGNAEELRETLRWMSDNREQAAEMGREGRRRVESEFDPETHYRRLLDLYERVMQR